MERGTGGDAEPHTSAASARISSRTRELAGPSTPETADGSRSSRRPLVGALAPGTAPGQLFVPTIDGQDLPLAEAKAKCKRMMIGGFFLLPWLWIINLWYFWPAFSARTDPHMTRMLRVSAGGASVVSTAFIVWLIAYAAARSRQGSLPSLDVRNFPDVGI